MGDGLLEVEGPAGCVPSLQTRGAGEKDVCVHEEVGVGVGGQTFTVKRSSK